MSVYELDKYDTDEIVTTLYYGDISVTLYSTDPYNVFAVSDSNFDGWVDNKDFYSNPAYKWPIEYQDDYDRCFVGGVFPDCPRNPIANLRIDATIMITYFLGTLVEPPPGGGGGGWPPGPE